MVYSIELLISPPYLSRKGAFMNKKYLMAFAVVFNLTYSMFAASLFASKTDFFEACYGNQTNTLISMSLDDAESFKALLQTHNKYEETPLHLVAERGNWELVKLFLQHGANPKKQDRWGRTPLHHAAQHNHVPMIKTLIRFGANPYIEAGKDEKKMYAFQYLHQGEKGYDEAVELLTLGQIELQKIYFLEETVKKYGVMSEEVQRILQKKARIFYSQLHSAAEGNNLLLEILLEYGADVNEASNSDFRTPLHAAISFHNVEGVRLLLAAGANPNATTRVGSTPIKLVKSGGYLTDAYTDENKQAIIDLLVAHGGKE